MRIASRHAWQVLELFMQNLSALERNVASLCGDVTVVMLCVGGANFCLLGL